MNSAKETSLLLYFLGYGSSGFIPLLNYAWLGVLSPERVDTLISFIKGRKEYVADGMRWYRNGSEICVQHEDCDLKQCTNAKSLLLELRQLKSRYNEAVKNGVTLHKGLLDFVGDNFTTQNLLLRTLAHAQDVENPDVAECWEMIVIYALTPISFASNAVGLGTLRDEITTAESNADDNWSQVIGQDLLMSRYDGVIHIQIFDIEAQCSGVFLVKELRKLLESYEQAVNLG